MNLFELYAKITLDTSEYESGLSKASGFTESFASKIGSGLKRIGQVATVALGAATTAAGAFVKSAVDVGSEFDATMSQVSSISGATGADFDALRKKALEMGASTSFSANEAAQAFTYMAMAGWKSNDMIAGISGIMDLAAASGEDLALTSDIVTDALTAFGKSADESGEFANVLAAASSNSNTNVAMLGESFKYVAPLAGTLDYSVKDVAVALGLMANSGIKASQAGTTLRAALSSMLKPTKPTIEAMEQLGLYADGTSVAMVGTKGVSKSLSDTIDILRNSFANLTEAEQAEYAAQIFGREAMSGMLAIINASEDDYNKLTTAIYNADGAARQMAQTMQDNLAGDIEQFGGAVESLQIIVSDKLTPSLRQLVQFGTEAIETLSTAFQDGGLQGAMQALGTILSEGINMVASKTPEMIAVGMQLLGALGQGLLDNLSVMTDAAGQILVQLVDGLVIALPALADGAARIIVQLSESLTTGESLQKLQQAADIIIPAIVDAIVIAAPALVDGGIAILDALAKSLYDNKESILDAGVAIVQSLASGITSSLPAFLLAAGPILTWIANLIKTVSSLKDVAGSVIQFITGQLSGTIDVVGKAKSAVQTLWTALSSHPLLIVAGAVAGLVAAIIGLWQTNEDFRNAVIEIWSNIKDAFVNTWKSAQEAWGIATEFFARIGDGIRSTFESVTSTLSEAFLSSWSAVKGAWGEATNFFSQKWGDITSVFSNALDWFTDIGANIVDGIKNGISSGWDALTSWIGGLVDGLIGGVKSILGINSPSKVFSEIGGNMALGLGVGWKDEYGSIKKQIENGMEFDTASVEFSASGIGRIENTFRASGHDYAANQRGGDIYNFYSPKALDPVSAAREMKRARQEMALGYI